MGSIGHRMTLILTIANSRGVHQCSDYQLTNQATYKPVSDRAGSKQLEAGFEKLHLNLAFTGVASGPLGRTIDRLSAKLKGLPHASTLQDICDALARHSAAIMKPHGSRGVLVLVLAVAAVGEPFRVVVISNVRDWNAKHVSAKKHFDIQIRTVKKPFHLISGFRGCVSQSERQRLKALARDIDRSPAEIVDALAAINATAARNSVDLVSEGCWVSSQIADGATRRWMIRNVGEHGDEVPHLMGGVDLVELMKRNIQAAPGQKLSVTHLGGVMGAGTPLPPPEGEPKHFKFSGSSATVALRSPSRKHFANVQIAQFDCVINARLNETVTVPFASVQVNPAQAAGEDFPKPKIPWPSISPAFAIDGFAVERGWEYAVCHWTEDGVHHLEVPRSSRGIRRLAFLKDDDELVIALVSGAQFTWRTSEDFLTATLEASVSWRTRPDGTRG
jgi:hypothetical protein